MQPRHKDHALEASQGVLVASWGFLTRFGNVLGASWGVHRVSWDFLEPSWGRLLEHKRRGIFLPWRKKKKQCSFCLSSASVLEIVFFSANVQKEFNISFLCSAKVQEQKNKRGLGSIALGLAPRPCRPEALLPPRILSGNLAHGPHNFMCFAIAAAQDAVATMYSDSEWDSEFVPSPRDSSAASTDSNANSDSDSDLSYDYEADQYRYDINAIRAHLHATLPVTSFRPIPSSDRSSPPPPRPPPQPSLPRPPPLSSAAFDPERRGAGLRLACYLLEIWPLCLRAGWPRPALNAIANCLFRTP